MSRSAAILVLAILMGSYDSQRVAAQQGTQGVIRGDVVFPDPASLSTSAEVSGELRQWHKVTLTIDGPQANEFGQAVHQFDSTTGALRLDVRPQAGAGGRYAAAHPNPFLDYRMTVTFTHESGTPSYDVPGYFAADGNAGETGAVAGNKWRAHLSPDRTGAWRWSVSFVAGPGVAVDETMPGEPYLPFDGLSGGFQVAASDKALPDFRARGRLVPTERHMRFAGDGTYFLKAGTDSPETLLGYADFDGTFAVRHPGQAAWIGPHDGHGLHEFAPHSADWREGDPTWHGGKGRGLIGAVNYLAGEGMNSMSFLTYSAGGDGENAWPFVSRNDKLHYDVSKLDQWGIFFDHAQSQGIFLHFKLQEQENAAGYPNRANSNTNATIPEALDGGVLGVERKLYTREIIARYGHLLALNWNMGEETTMTTENLREWSEYIRTSDPYGHHLVLHTYPGGQEAVYTPLLGTASALTGVSIQTNFDNGHQQTLRWIRESREAGRPWAVAFDEQGNANTGVPPDPGYAGWNGLNTQGQPVVSIDEIRKYTLWGTLMAGGWGVEYYFGYGLPENDLVAEDLRSRDRSWDYARHALDFFHDNQVPFWEMESCNARVGNLADDNSRYCFGKEGEQYLVYLPDGGSSRLDLSGAAGREFSVRWYDPRNGGALRAGSVATVRGGGEVALGNPPGSPDEDWLVLVR